MIGQDWFSGLYKITFAIVEHDEQNDPILRPDLVLIRKYAIYLFEAFSEYVMNPNESTFLKRINVVDAEMAVIRQNVMTDHYNGQKEKIIKTLSEYHYCFGFMRLSLMVYMLGRIKETRHIIDKIVMIERRFSLPLQDQEKLN